MTKTIFDSASSEVSEPANENTVWILNPYLHVIRCSANEFVVRHGGRSRFSQIIRDDGRTG